MLAAQQPGASVPASFWRWFGRRYPIAYYNWQWQMFGVQVTAVPGQSYQNGTIMLDTDFWCFGVRSIGNPILEAGRPLPTEGNYSSYRIGLSSSPVEQWSVGKWLSMVVTGNGGVLGRGLSPQQFRHPADYTFGWPRELRAPSQVLVEIDTQLITPLLQAVLIDVVIHGIAPRRRQTPLRPRQ